LLGDRDDRTSAGERSKLVKVVLAEDRLAKLASFARRCPVVAITEQTLGQRLLELCRDSERRRALGEEGRRYATTVHGPDTAARAAEHVYAHAESAAAGIYEANGDGIRTVA
jgi:hypothetical protein